MPRLPSLSRVAVRALEIAGAGLTSAVVAFLLGRVDTPAPPPPALPAVVHLAPSDEEMIRSVRNDQAALLERLRSDPQAPKTQIASVLQVPSPQVPPQVASPQAVSPQAVSPQVTAAQGASAQAASPAEVAAPSAAAKPVKSAPAVARRDHKPERVRAADAKPRIEPAPEQPLQIQPPAAASTDPSARPLTGASASPLARAPGQPDVTVASGVVPAPAPVPESESHLTSTFKQITTWLLPSRDRTPENVPPASVPRPPKPVGELPPSAM